MEFKRTQISYLFCSIFSNIFVDSPKCHKNRAVPGKCHLVLRVFSFYLQRNTTGTVCSYSEIETKSLHNIFSASQPVPHLSVSRRERKQMKKKTTRKEKQPEFGHRKEPSAKRTKKKKKKGKKLAEQNHGRKFQEKYRTTPQLLLPCLTLLNSL